MNTYLLEPTVIAIGMAGLSGFIIGAAAVVLIQGTSKNSPFQPPRKSDSKLLDSERGMLAWDSLASSI